MDLEALLLGVEPMVALGLGLAALLVAPLVGALGNTEAGQSLVDSGRSMTKHGIRIGVETFNKVQETLAEVGESWNDLVAEAKAEVKVERNAAKAEQARRIEIVTD